MSERNKKHPKNITKKVRHPFLNVDHLPKKPRSRFPMVQTYIMNCNQNKMRGFKSVKYSSETGMGTDEFVHVILSHLDGYEKPVIVKIHDDRSIFVNRELKALEQLKNFNNSVSLICHFSCNDEKERWENSVRKQVSFCNNKKDKLHFFIFEYIENSELDIFLKRNNSLPSLKSLFLQTTIMIVILYEKYHILHGDLNTGNILIGKSSETIIHYSIKDLEIDIESHGIIPLLIDWGRSYFLYGEENSFVIQDILTILTIMTRWLKDKELQDNITVFLKENENENNCVSFIKKLEIFFDSL
jgi:serine/threonine protein kinase